MPTAFADLQEIDAAISASSHQAADRFLDLLSARIESLDLFPRRGTRARESKGIGLELRQLVVQRYRILYHVRGFTVFVFRIGHGGRRSLPLSGRR